MNSSGGSEPLGNVRAKQLNALLSEARKRLIDTGTRNRLVHTNRRAKKPATLAILYSDLDTLFAELVRNDRSLRFRSDPRLTGKPESEEEQDHPDDDLMPAEDTLQTRIAEETLQRRLLKFFRDAKTLEEEQGINILYLAIGFLRWYEDENSEVLREAPLILVPVTLTRDARRSTFDLKGREDDIGTNFPLAERLREFGIALPEISDDDQFLPSEYFDAVEEAIGGKPRWSIDRTGTELGLFSFAKLLMFHDLAGDAWPTDSILNHPLLQKLMMDGFESEDPLYPDSTRIDEKFSPADLVHVVDADGSQTLAIETIRAARNLVIQGPPGTGKSQTIANIIASAAHDGKTVLFVAEKMVALDVVHSRLARAGLGQICLELHSRATNKRLLAEELERTLSTPGVEPSFEREIAKLKEIRDRLNTISQTLHKPIATSGKSPFQVIGDLVHARGQNLTPPTLSISSLAEWDAATYQKTEALLKQLSQKVAKTGPRDNHPWRGVRNCEVQPPELERLRARFSQHKENLTFIAKLCGDGAILLDWPTPKTFMAARLFANLLQDVRSAPIEKSTIIRRLNSLNASDLDAVKEVAEIGISTTHAVTAFDSTYRPVALSVDLANVRSTLARSASWLSRLGPSYRKASAELNSWLTVPLPKSAADRIELVDKLSQTQASWRAFSDAEIRGRSLLQDIWNGLKTDFAGVLTAHLWLKRSKEAGRATIVEKMLFLAEQGETASLLLERINADISALRDAIQNTFDALALDTVVAFGKSNRDDIEFDSLTARFSEWMQSLDLYVEWAELTELESELQQAGASDLNDRLANGSLHPAEAVSELRHARAEALWTLGLKDSELRKIKNDNRSALVEEFKKLDADCRRAAAALIRAQHVAKMPRGAFGEMAIIRGEIARKRGHMPIRKLIQRAGRTIQAIKPVFMMSPISVAQYLKPGALSFDLVVIDEASQVRPEDALGVIARATQIVVVGDRHQLPPTNFFSRLLEDDNDEDESESDEPVQLSSAAKVTELESILTLCEARGVSSKMLRWHYRSRHPSLIEVSNAEFYRSHLFLPPAPIADRDLKGLVIHRVNGAYDRGGKRTNAIEAQAIADAVAKHAASAPDQTLGVVTFSTAQRDLVSDYLDERRRTDPIVDSFLSAGQEEVFVKNLENVQGDERDVILVSVGYGPRQAGGRLDSMSFGPVSTDGGERRLNVLFTRARHRCEVFTSFDSGDIDLNRATGAGPRVFKRFLSYAETGVLDQPTAPPDGDYDSYFEEDVANEVRASGYHVDSQVGSAGFKIDLGARDPQRPGRYILAIECDGATYHHSLWARERDRLRQEVLETMGWRFHRIWSTDWFYRREHEIERLKVALKEAVSHKPMQPEICINVSAPDDKSEVALPREFEPELYEVAEFRIPSATRIEPHEASLTVLSEVITKIVAIEGPIHADEVARRLAGLWGKDRVGSRISATVNAALKHLKAGGAIISEDGFWFTTTQRDDCPIRDRAAAPPSLQRADMLPPLEIRAAIFQTLKDNGSIQKQEITTAVTRIFGFQRTGSDLRERILRIVADLVEKGSISTEGEWLNRSRTSDPKIEPLN